VSFVAVPRETLDQSRALVTRLRSQIAQELNGFRTGPAKALGLVLPVGWLLRVVNGYTQAVRARLRYRAHTRTPLDGHLRGVLFPVPPEGEEICN